MDLSFLAPLGGFLTVIGGGAVWLFNRADRQREHQERSALSILKTQNAALAKESKSRLRDGTKWREQLIRHDLIPDPADWSDMEPTE